MSPIPPAPRLNVSRTTRHARTRTPNLKNQAPRSSESTMSPIPPLSLERGAHSYQNLTPRSNETPTRQLVSHTTLSLESDAHFPSTVHHARAKRPCPLYHPNRARYRTDPYRVKSANGPNVREWRSLSKHRATLEKFIQKPNFLF